MDHALHNTGLPSAGADLRSVSLIKRGHVWRFAWSEGDEGRVVEAALRLAARGDCPLDELDAAVVRHHVWASRSWRSDDPV